MANKVRGLKERLNNGESVICAEGYLWELERRGYATFGNFTPEVVLDEPERVRSLHEEFVHAGSDVVEAYTYYGHRSKMKLIGREDELEMLNMRALKMARDVADRTGTLMAGSLSNTASYDPDKPETRDIVYDIFKEQVEWAVKGGADYIVAETFDSCSEANIALDAILENGNGLPAVITLTAYVPDRTIDEVPIPEALAKLEARGATVVGVNCGRGPATILPLLRDVRKACKGPIAALPVAFRTTPQQKSFQSLKDPVTGAMSYPTELSPHQCTRSDIRKFGEEARELGIQYVGICCGNASHYVRELAVAYGRCPPAVKYEPKPGASVVTGDNPLNDRMRKWRAFMMGDVD